MHAAHPRSPGRALLAQRGAQVRILYGGSVKALERRAKFSRLPMSTARLVGGASLKAADFMPIVAAAAVRGLNCRSVSTQQVSRIYSAMSNHRKGHHATHSGIRSSGLGCPPHRPRFAQAAATTRRHAGRRYRRRRRSAPSTAVKGDNHPGQDRQARGAAAARRASPLNKGKLLFGMTQARARCEPSRRASRRPRQRSRRGDRQGRRWRRDRQDRQRRRRQGHHRSAVRQEDRSSAAPACRGNPDGTVTIGLTAEQSERAGQCRRPARLDQRSKSAVESGGGAR